jgi:hypothetical protein
MGIDTSTAFVLRRQLVRALVAAPGLAVVSAPLWRKADAALKASPAGPATRTGASPLTPYVRTPHERDAQTPVPRDDPHLTSAN